MQKIDRCSALPWVRGAAVLALVACAAVAPAASGEGGEAPAASEVAVCAVAPESAAPPTAAVALGVDEAPIATSTTGVWTFFSRENCWDLWLTSCSTAWPPDQCPPNPAGKPCSPLRDTCWHVINSNVVDMYRCKAAG